MDIYWYLKIALFTTKLNIFGFFKENWDGDKEIALYNLFHLLRRIELNYGNDSAYNAKISLMRELKKVLSTFISENRTKKINTIRKNQLLKELHNIINIFLPFFF